MCIIIPCFIFREQDIKSLVYVLNILGLDPYSLYERRRFRKFWSSTLLSVYNFAMLLIFLYVRLAVIIGNIFNDSLDNVSTFAAMMISSPHVTSHSFFLLSTLLFLGEFVNFMHVLFYLNSSIYFTFISFDSNFNYVKAQISVLVPLHNLSAFLILSKFEMKKIPAFLSLYQYGLSVLSINVVTVLFINWAVLLKRGFTRKSMCLCEMIRCAGEESVGLYRQISTVKHPQMLIAVH